MMLWHDLYSRWADEEIEEMCGTIAEDLERLGDKVAEIIYVYLVVMKSIAQISHAISLLNSDTPMIMSSNQTESAISQVSKSLFAHVLLQSPITNLLLCFGRRLSKQLMKFVSYSVTLRYLECKWMDQGNCWMTMYV